MGIFEKLKNALFEEEYVEVEEKPKTKQVSKKSRPSEIKKESVREDKDRAKEEKPIAKKIVLPEKKESYADELEEEVLEDNDFKIESLDETEKTVKRQFRVMDDSDFAVDDDMTKYYPEGEPQIVKVIEKEVLPSNVHDNDNLYHGRVPNQPYGSMESPRNTVNEYHVYETKREETTHFTPSPIISPIYGILDKNYKKEDVVSRREVRLTSSFEKEKLNVDDVREKAFGRNVVEESVVAEKKEVVRPTFEVETTTNLLVDLSSDESKPAVKDVTVGDAVEYFEDLGLEYNVDYLDASKKASGRRVKDNYDDEHESDLPNGKGDEEPKLVEVKDDPLDDDDNLFDLIDSMYQEQE